MAGITAALVKELREETNLGMMECKRALTEADGDKGKAIRLLRERGVAVAQKRASRATNQGRVASCVKDDGKVGSLVEVNCETDFVARNESFGAFVTDLSEQACDTDWDLAEAARDNLVAKIAEIGENITIRRNVRYVLDGTGMVASYIHMGGKVGVLVEVTCGKDETVASDTFKETVKDICMHIAASGPSYLDESDVPEDVLASEREIFRRQVEGKPENVIDKIVSGKIRKFCAEICLLQQGFVKEPKTPVRKYLDQRGKEMDDTLNVRRFVRYRLGEA